MRRQIAFALLSFLFLAAACGEGGTTASTLLDREAFIETYVELRLGAIQSSDFTVSTEARDEILRSNGADREALLAFVDAHGRDPEYMTALWTEVDTRLNERREALSVEGQEREPR
ncbi:MAG: hypothetical protein WEB90_01240 [Gemmatimonadota bacterium]